MQGRILLCCPGETRGAGASRRGCPAPQQLLRGDPEAPRFSTSREACVSNWHCGQLGLLPLCALDGQSREGGDGGGGECVCGVRSPASLLLLPWVTEPRAGEWGQALGVEITASASVKKKLGIWNRETMGKSTEINIPRLPGCERGSQEAEASEALHKSSSHQTRWSKNTCKSQEHSCALPTWALVQV